MYWHQYDSKAHLCRDQESRAALASGFGELVAIRKFSLARKACQLV